MSAEIITVFVFAIVQSIFGIGILFFGTPTLIIIGFSFPQTLSVLLPASITVSLLQVWQSGLPKREITKDFGFWCLIPLAVSLAGCLILGWDIELELFIAITLFAFALIRIMPTLNAALQMLVRQYPRFWLATIGIVHGLSNLGGGLLGIFAVSLSSDKTTVRGNIAFCYFCFAVIQLSALAILTPQVIHTGQLGYAVIAGGVFLLLERRLFGSIGSPVFDRMFTFLIAAYSVLIFLKSSDILNV